MLKGAPQTLTSKFKISYNLLLNLIDIGDTNFVSFAQKSMIKDEIDSQLNETDTEIENAHKSIEKMKETLKHTKTPVEIVKEYIDLCERRQHAVNKKRKDIDRQIESIKDNYKTIETDKTIVMKFEEMKYQEETLMRRKNNIQQYISNNVVDTINTNFAEIVSNLDASSSVSETTIKVSIRKVATGIKIAVTVRINVK